MVKGIILSCLSCCSLFASQEKLLQSVMDGRVGFFSSVSMYSALPGAAFEEKGKGIFYYASGIDNAVCNGIMEEGNNIPSESEIDQAIAYFKSRNLPFIWWTAAPNLEQKGFQFGGILKGIAVDISAGVPDAKINIEVKQITSRDDLKTFSAIICDAFGMPSVEQFQAAATGAMNHQEQVHFMAYVDGKPAGTATLAVSESAAGIWNMATVPEFRKRGAGSALVHAAMLEAQKQGYNQVMAVLMPKGMAWGLFTKLGFKEVCEFPFYVYGVSAEALEK